MNTFGTPDGRFRRAGRALAAVGLCLMLSACSLFGGGEDEPQYVERPVQDLYNAAMDAMLIGDNFEAARLFDEVERQHPAGAPEPPVGCADYAHTVSDLAFSVPRPGPNTKER